MYYLNKIIGAFLNPLGIGLLLALLAIVLVRLKRCRLSCMCGLLSVVWLWFWSTGAVGRWIGLSLEREFPPQLAETMPSADAIVVLGGGVGENTNACPYAELEQAADRAWHGARLYKAGKAQKVFVTCEADARFMVDLGVPGTAIAVNNKARNTEEEARALVEVLSPSRTVDRSLHCSPAPSNFASSKPKVLLVTSAWHMRRAKLMYERYATGVEVIPAAADHESTMMFDRPLEFKDFVPDSVMLAFNAYMFKEWIAYYGYKWLRR
ncbi:MAG: YdcF family protein [Kiritimatiellae bacterium]|nr:YdcF family protein [Kiritimatiellia bacterium]